ncbi:hypothetical protein DFP72DRAFT_1046495 [Ephemerocybe angulata]|uniref:Uncharacterized protein n=1 Tax=Ephemerocybe angulata TaxID=980116 RepID=A0A8H6HWR5_9AGAR|nr:hypothetical protein DFP72DRAFT_1046495 [Tulosesus angulatus]
MSFPNNNYPSELIRFAFHAPRFFRAKPYSAVPFHFRIDYAQRVTVRRNLESDSPLDSPIPTPNNPKSTCVNGFATTRRPRIESSSLFSLLTNMRARVLTCIRPQRFPELCSSPLHMVFGVSRRRKDARTVRHTIPLAGIRSIATSPKSLSCMKGRARRLGFQADALSLARSLAVIRSITGIPPPSSLEPTLHSHQHLVSLIRRNLHTPRGKNFCCVFVILGAALTWARLHLGFWCVTTNNTEPFAGANSIAPSSIRVLTHPKLLASGNEQTLAQIHHVGAGRQLSRPTCGKGVIAPGRRGAQTSAEDWASGRFAPMIVELCRAWAGLIVDGDVVVCSVQLPYASRINKELECTLTPEARNVNGTSDRDNAMTLQTVWARDLTRSGKLDFAMIMTHASTSRHTSIPIPTVPRCLYVRAYKLTPSSSELGDLDTMQNRLNGACTKSASALSQHFYEYERSAHKLCRNISPSDAGTRDPVRERLQGSAASSADRMSKDSGRTQAIQRADTATSIHTCLELRTAWVPNSWAWRGVAGARLSSYVALRVAYRRTPAACFGLLSYRTPICGIPMLPKPPVA